MKRKFEEPEMQVIVFGSEDTMQCTSGTIDSSAVDLVKLYGGYQVGGLYVLENDDM